MKADGKIFPSAFGVFGKEFLFLAAICGFYEKSVGKVRFVAFSEKVEIGKSVKSLGNTARKLRSVENPDRQIQGCGYAHPKRVEEHGPGPGLFCKKYLIYQPYGSRKVEQNDNLARKGQFQSEEKKTPKHVEDAVYSR